MINTDIQKKARSAKDASKALYNCPTNKKNNLLKAINKRLGNRLEIRKPTSSRMTEPRTIQTILPARL